VRKSATDDSTSLEEDPLRDERAGIDSEAGEDPQAAERATVSAGEPPLEAEGTDVPSPRVPVEPAGRIADRHRHAAPAPAPGANLEQHVAFVDVAVVAPVVVEPSTEERAQPLRQPEVERAVAVGAPLEPGPLVPRLLPAVDPFSMRARACRGKRRFRVRAGGDGAMVGG